MKKIFIISTTTIIVFSLYVTPLWGREQKTEEIIINETNAETNGLNKNFITYFQAGVEEVFNSKIEEVVQEETEITNIDTTVYSGWATARINVRTEPNTESEILETIEFNEKIEYQLYNDEWAKIDYNGVAAYVYKIYISDNENTNKEYSVPRNDGFKSYMSYRAITSKSSKQYKLQKSYAYTGNSGIRMIYNRYCIALGTYFNAPVGTYVDLVLENGTIIPCIVSEIKANKDTDKNNIVTVHNGCVSEFLVDMKSLDRNSKRSGDISSCKKDWNSPVEKIKVYRKNIL